MSFTRHYKCLYHLGWEKPKHNTKCRNLSDKLTSEKLIFVCLKYKQKGSIQTGKYLHQ